MLKIVRGNLKG